MALKRAVLILAGLCGVVLSAADVPWFQSAHFLVISEDPIEGPLGLPFDGLDDLPRLAFVLGLVAVATKG